MFSAGATKYSYVSPSPSVTVTIGADLDLAGVLDLADLSGVEEMADLANPGFHQTLLVFGSVIVGVLADVAVRSRLSDSF